MGRKRPWPILRGFSSRCKCIASFAPRDDGGECGDRCSPDERSDLRVPRSGVLTDLAANVAPCLFDDLVERATRGIEHKMLAIPRFIVSIDYFVPARQFEAADVRGSAFRSPPVNSQVTADQFDLDDMCRVL